MTQVSRLLCLRVALVDATKRGGSALYALVRVLN